MKANKTVKITRVASKKHLEYFAVSEKILNFAAEFIHHLTEGNQRTLGQDALRPLLFLIGHKNEFRQRHAIGTRCYLF